MEALIRFDGISKSFPGTQALKDISFDINRGEIHSIVGANGAGKSTLMNILGGQYSQTSGEIIFDGEPVEISSPYKALNLGIAVVYQELKLCDNLRVYENIFLGKEIRNDKGGLDWQKMKEESANLLDKLKAGIDPRDFVKNLTIGKKQLVEIARALRSETKVLVLDEPTSALSVKDSEKLFEIVKHLRDDGVSIIFISHRMDEVFAHSDRITALRDGEYRGTYPIGEVSQSKIIELIVGSNLSKEINTSHGQERSGAPIMQVQNLSRGRYFTDVSFTLKEGEILGIYGLQGAGRTELLETLFGLERAENGSITLLGKEISSGRVTECIKKGMILVPEDRRGKGLFAKMDVLENVNSALPAGHVKMGFIRKGKWRITAAKAVKDLSVKTSGLTQKMENLSGGNQQKVIIGKWLTKNPRVLLLDEVTRGIDVGAKAEIFKLIRTLRDKGLSVLLVSSEVEEIIAECDRSLVMWNGRMVAEVSSAQMDKTELVSLAMGVKHES